MSDKDKAAFLEYLKGKPVKASKQLRDFKSIVIKHKPAFLPDCPACAHCRSTHVIKHGLKDNAQRYLCKDCGRTFAITNNTLLYYSKKPVEVWEKYFECLMNIQTINSYHSELKRLVHGNFKGVATKYLNNYVVYNN